MEEIFPSLVTYYLGKRRSPVEYVADLEDQLQKIYQMSRENLNIYSSKMKVNYDVAATATTFDVGDRVWLYNPKRTRGVYPKLERTWEGAYEVLKKMSDAVYRAQKLGGRAKPKLVHLNRLAPYQGMVDVGDRHP